MHENSDTAAALDDLLDRERQALLRGDLDGLIRLHASKESLLEQLNRTGGDLDNLSAVQKKLHRNQSLVQSALRGVRSAIQKVQQARNNQGQVVTYTESGSRNTVHVTSTGSMERRA